MRLAASLLVIAACSNGSGGSSGSGGGELPPVAAKLVADLRAKWKAALAIEQRDPATLPRCTDVGHTMLLDRAKTVYAAGEKPGAPAIKTVELLQTGLACGNTLLDQVDAAARWKRWFPANEADWTERLTRVPAFCYWREDVVSQFLECGAPDATGRMACAKVVPGRSVIDVVRHPDAGPPCANRIEIEHPITHEVGVDDKGRTASELLQAYFENQPAGTKVVAGGCPSAAKANYKWDAYRVSVDGTVICDRR